MTRSLKAIVPFILLATLAAACSPDKDRHRTPEPLAAKPANMVTGEALFVERCQDCHMLLDKGGTAGPDLSDIWNQRSYEELVRTIREPSKTFPGTIMPPNNDLTVEQIDSLIDFLDTSKFKTWRQRSRKREQ